MTGLYMLVAALLLLAVGYPVAFTFGAVSIIFGFIAAFFELMPDATILEVVDEFAYMFSMMPFRIYGTMTNKILMAIPLFIFMGLMLERSGLAAKLLESMGTLFGRVRGGVAVSVILVGTLLAASTGVVGASVVAMGVISLPVMLRQRYDRGLACGTICASGTLGQIIPPSIILIILADVFGLAVGDLFQAAILPSLVLVGSYIAYILVLSFFKREAAPAMAQENVDYLKVLFAVVPPLLLIVLVLGSIFAGIATPTESASIGAFGSILLAALYKKLSLQTLQESALETVKITSMVIAILIGATAFSMVFVYTGADMLVEGFFTGLPGEMWGFVLLSMLIVFVLGFFIDFIEISYIVVPILLPAAEVLGIDPLWFAVLIAMNLQSSFLTPPFGFSLFYLKGVAPKGVVTTDIYRGVLPFIVLQLVVLATLVLFPQLYGFAALP